MGILEHICEADLALGGEGSWLIFGIYRCYISETRLATLHEPGKFNF